VRDILKSLVALSYFSRGATSYTDMLELTPYERDLINEFQTEHVKRELESGNNNY
jgi:hypothetical protein